MRRSKYPRTRHLALLATLDEVEARAVTGSQRAAASSCVGRRHAVFVEFRQAPGREVQLAYYRRTARGTALLEAQGQP